MSNRRGVRSRALNQHKLVARISRPQGTLEELWQYPSAEAHGLSAAVAAGLESGLSAHLRARTIAETDV
jgi:hypothetical protein